MRQAEPANFPEFEKKILESWEREQTFKKSLAARRGAKTFSFYDGPPFANGLPHFGHSLVTSIKDSLGRYKTMRGYYVERRNGWDCHGLPVEFAIEKEFGISGKKQILELGLAKFNEACRASVFKYKTDWEDFFKRIGRWTDAENAYATIDTSYTESVWWVIAQINRKKLLYKGFKSMPYCPRCATPLSNFELNEGYRDGVEDPSLFVKFKLKDGRWLLAWTTTPWSLPGNAAIAVSPTGKYVTVQAKTDDGKTEELVLAEKRLEVLDSDYKILKKEKGTQLAGLQYEPLFKVDEALIKDHPNVYKVWASDVVAIEDGTGVLHVAPAYGEDDLNLGQANDLPILHNVDQAGQLKKGYGHDELAGAFFKNADRDLIEKLDKHGQVFAAETLKHTYPFCYRCDSALLYYAIDTWFIKVTGIKDELLKTAQDINWVPGHVKYGRFGKWLEGARDWAISRNRYWGAPMPVWVNEVDDSDYLVVESIAELKELSGVKEIADLHRPFIDEIVIKKDGKTYRRIEEVVDCWVESGSMPFAQQHYPFEHKKEFDLSFPADYIGEGLDQTRLWFYVMHVISTIVEDKPAYKNVLVNSIVLAADGQKLSKRLRNYPPIEEVFSDEGADSLRLYLLSNYQAVAADYMRFNRDDMRSLQRNVLMTLWNVYSFLSTYADIDGWRPVKDLVEPKPSNVLDKWILSRLAETMRESTKQGDKYNLPQAINPIFGLIDDLSNWYVRRSRRRFSKDNDASDRASAFAALHYTLTKICQLMAPWAPFLSDKIYRELVSGLSEPASVHLTDWPEAGEVDAELLESMTRARAITAEGLAQRAAAGIRVRQPLARLGAPSLPAELGAIVREEVNVKELTTAKTVKLDTKLTAELRREGLVRDLLRHIQDQRKTSGLKAGDHINLKLELEGELFEAAKAHEQLISTETFADKLEISSLAGEADAEVKIGQYAATIGITRI